MRRRGFQGFREFDIPIGVVEQPYVERVILVYHNFTTHFASLYYPLPGYTFLTPVLGLLVYNASDLSAKNLSELDFRALSTPIRVHFYNVRPASGSRPMCVYFGLDGSVQFDNVVHQGTRTSNNANSSGLTCLTTNQGHYSIVTQTSVPPAPSPSGIAGRVTGNGKSKRVEIVVVSVIGGVLVFTLLVVMLACFRKCMHTKKIRRMEDAADSGVVLPMTRVGNTKAPVAMETRTRPFLENEFVP